MTYPTDNWPTIPVVWRNELPRCVGACKQGRIPCPHPLACSCTTLSPEEFSDVATELTTDRMPLINHAGAEGELPTITGRLTDEEDASIAENNLFLCLLLIALAAWVAVVWNLIAIWRATP